MMPDGARFELLETLGRNVLFAVELVDPVTQSLVSGGIDVTVDGLAGRPIVNRSGRFVWLEEADAWPGAISVTPRGAPFLPQVIPGPPRPASPGSVSPVARLATVVLRPAPSYPFGTDVTAVRGSVQEGPASARRPVTGAVVQLAWHDKSSDAWSPPRPVARASGSTSPRDVETDTDGQFVAFLRLRREPLADPDFDENHKNLLKVRLQLARPDDPFPRATPDDYPFLPGSPGRVPEGELLARDVALVWEELLPI